MIGKPIEVRFDTETRARIEQLAAERHAKLAEVIRDLVKQALEGTP